MEIDEPTTVICKIRAMEEACFSYKACSNCETSFPETPSSHYVCNSKKCKGRSFPYTRFFSLLFSIEVDAKDFTVICFDKAAKVIFGCSAQEFFDFSFLHPHAAKNASKVLSGERFKITLRKPERIEANHLRMTNVVPLRSDFQPVIKTLEELYPVLYGDKAA